MKRSSGDTGHLLLAILLIAWSWLPLYAQATEVLERAPGPARVLVVPGGHEELARAPLFRSDVLEPRVAQSPAKTFQGLLADSSFLDTVRAGTWHYVVLAGHPTFGKTFLIEGEARVGDASDFLHHGRLLLEEIRRAGARPILLIPPAHPGTPAIDRQAIDWAYTRLARTGGAALAPVADAFARAQRRRPDLALFGPHGDDWSTAGAFLASAVLDAAITGRPSHSTSASDSRPDSAEIPPEVREMLTREAWEAVRDLAASGGYRDVPPPAFPAVPILARGEPLELTTLTGRWRGSLRLYPWPATLAIEIRPGSRGPEVSGRVDFGSQRRAVAFAAIEVESRNGVFSFTNPSDLAEGRTSYRLVSTGGRLSGVAELTTERGDVYAIASVVLEKVRHQPIDSQP